MKQTITLTLNRQDAHRLLALITDARYQYQQELNGCPSEAPWYRANLEQCISLAESVEHDIRKEME